MAFGAEETVALGGTRGDCVVVILLAPLLYAEGAALPCMGLGHDGAVALVTVVLGSIICGLA